MKIIIRAQSISASSFLTVVRTTGGYPGPDPVGVETEMMLQAHPGLGGRELYSKEQWEAQKPVIRQLYNIENMPYKRVIEVLRTEHQFYPTRRQFYRRIGEWGYEKNIKDKEMRALIRDLSQKAEEGGDVHIELKGRDVDPLKIQRWRRRHGGALDVPRPLQSDSTRVVSSSEGFINAAEDETSAETLDNFTSGHSRGTNRSEAIGDSRSNDFSHWNLVDVPGSPLLTRLFEALEIECHSLVPSLDLDSSDTSLALPPTSEKGVDIEMNDDMDTQEGFDFSLGMNSNDITRYSREVFQGSEMILAGSNQTIAELSFSEWAFREWDFSRGQPFKMNSRHIFGLSPFPALRSPSSNRSSGNTHLSALTQLQSLRDEELRFRRMLRNFKRIFGAGSPKVLIIMDNLAATYSRQGKYDRAEQLYRKIAIEHQRAVGLEHRHTLLAYLKVVDLLHSQGSALQARKIHQGIHDIRTKNFCPDDQIVLFSNSIKTSRLYNSGQLHEAEELMRQTFQLELCTFGPWDHSVLFNMRVLSEIVEYCGKPSESEHLIRINIHLFRKMTGPLSRQSLQSTQRLVCTFLRQGRFEEAKSLAVQVVEQTRAALGHNHCDTLEALFSVASCVRRQGDLVESERLLRDVVERQVRNYGGEETSSFMYMSELAIVLTGMERHAEATTFFEKCAKGWILSCGYSDGDTYWGCRELARNYEKLGRSGDAVALWQRYIEDGQKVGESSTEELLRGVSRIARRLGHKDRYKDAANCFEGCLRSLPETYRWSDEQTCEIFGRLGWCYVELERYDEALALYRRAFQWFRETEGEQHLALTEVTAWIAWVQELLAASAEQAGEEKDDVDRAESLQAEEAPCDVEDVDMRVEETTTSAGEDWIGELFDFDLLEKHASSQANSDEGDYVNKT